MDGVSAVSAAGSAGVASGIALRTLEMANDQQESVLSLLDAAMEVAEQVQEAGKGEHIDVQA